MRAALLLVLALAACGPADMTDQQRIDPYEEDGSMVAPEGSVARDELPRAVALAVPPPVSAELIRRGGDRFAIFCAPCHGAAGDGIGRVPNIPEPPDLTTGRLDSRRVVTAITRGFGAMPSYANRLEPRDRWAVAAWLADRRRRQ